MTLELQNMNFEFQNMTKNMVCDRIFLVYATSKEIIIKEVQLVCTNVS